MGHKSDMGPTGLMSGSLHSCVYTSGSSRGESCTLPTQISEAVPIPWLMALFLHLQSQRCCVPVVLLP